jgi:hypothetical protein
VGWRRWRWVCRGTRADGSGGGHSRWWMVVVRSEGTSARSLRLRRVLRDVMRLALRHSPSPTRLWLGYIITPPSLISSLGSYPAINEVASPLPSDLAIPWISYPGLTNAAIRSSILMSSRRVQRDFCNQERAYVASKQWMMCFVLYCG